MCVYKVRADTMAQISNDELIRHVQNGAVTHLLRALAEGRVPTFVDEYGNTLLHHAVRSPSRDSGKIIQLLVAHGVPVDIKNNEGYTALGRAIGSCKYWGVVVYATTNGFHRDHYRYWSLDPWFPVICELLEHSSTASINKVKDSLHEILHLAIRFSEFVATRTLLETLARKNILTPSLLEGALGFATHLLDSDGTTTKQENERIRETQKELMDWERTFQRLRSPAYLQARSIGLGGKHTSKAGFWQ